MKTRIIYAMLSALLLTGCTDWLMVQPRGAEIASKLEHYEGLLYGTELFSIGEVFPYMCFENTCDKDGYENIYSMIGSSACNAYKWQADIFRQDEECAEWNFPASSMYNVNIVINEVMQAEDGTEEEKLAIQSEARMVRAYMHFLMAQFFSKPYDAATASHDLCIPVITEASTVGQDFPRKTVAQVYDFIVTEMEESVPHLQDRAPHFKRVFKTAGYAMLGKVYWMTGRYEDAADAFEQAMDAVSDFGTEFLDYNTLMADGKMTYPTDDKLNPEQLYNIENMFLLWHAMYPSYYGSVLIYIKNEALTKYFTSTDDLRLSCISGLNSGETALGKPFDSREKYYINLTRISVNMGMTLPDLYLMYAECLARTDRSDEAVSLLTDFRAARFPAGEEAVPADCTSGDDLVRFCIEERFREILGYGLTWFDMRRLWNDPLFQDLKEMYVHNDGTSDYTLAEQRLVMRIPPSILIWHPEYTDNE